MERSFSKYCASGNDFILFDDRDNTFPSQEKELISKLCHRNYGVGADGVILLQRSSKAMARMQIFNADGSEAEMCGNGIRCLKKFAFEVGITHPFLVVETLDNVISLKEENDEIAVEMPGGFKIEDFAVEWEGKKLSGYSVRTGVPHVVLFVDELHSVDFSRLGPYVRHHPHFAPHGTNVNIAQKVSSTHIEMKTYERGSGATLACGTGVVAVGLVGAKKYNMVSPIRIKPPSQLSMSVGFQLANGQFSNVILTGKAYCSFKGFVNLEIYR